MDTTQFLERVLVPDKYIYVAHLTKQKRFWHKAFDAGDYAQAAAYMLKAADREDVYIALGGFRRKEVEVEWQGETKMRPRRKIDNVDAVKCFYVDLDCGFDKNGEPKPFKDKAEALEALKTMVGKGIVPPPSIVIDSGGGIHVYWTLEVAMPVHQWVPLADAFKKHMLANGFSIDPGITGDPARVLRAPGTTNYKHNKLVRVLLDTGKDVDPAKLEALVGGAAEARPSLLLPKGPGAVDISEFTDGVSDNKAPAYMSKICERCPAMRAVLDSNGADQSEPYWMATVHLASFCEDGERMAHVLSSGYKGYSQSETQEKFEARLAVDRSTIGPTTCKAFSQYTLACQSCVHWGKIKSPIVLGGPSDLPLMPPGFKLVNGELSRQIEVKNEDGVIGYEWSRVCWFLIDSVELVVEEGITSLAVGWRAKPTGAHRLAMFQLGELADDRTFSKVAHTEGQTLQTPQMKVYRTFMVAFTTLLQQHSDPVAQHAPFGWSQSHGKPWFGMGNVGFLPGNKEEPINSARSHAIVNQYMPAGSMDEWKKVSEFLLGQNHLPLVAIYASAFAAPLMEFMGLSGVLVSAISPGSGVGKSSSLELAASVWGNPKTTVHAIDDTPAMISRKMALTSSLPAYWDELRVKGDVQALVKHVFRITQGKDKSRLRSDTSFNLGHTWSTMMLVASNTSLFDYVLKDGGGEAGFYRVFEFEVDPPPRENIDVTVALFSKLSRNYGHAGRIYARYLVENRDDVKKRCDAVWKAIASHVNASASERFWCGTITALLVGAVEANNAGLTSFDVPALKAYLLDRYEALRAMQSGDLAEDLDEQGVLADFLVMSTGNTLISSTVFMQRGRPSGKDIPMVKKPPTRELWAQIGLDDGRVRIASRPFREFLQSKGLPQTTTVKILQKQGLLSQKARGTIGAGTIYSTPAPTWCYDLLPGAVSVDQIIPEGVK